MFIKNFNNIIVYKKNKRNDVSLFSPHERNS